MAKRLSPRLQIHQQIAPCLLSITEAAVYIGGTNSLVVHLMREGKLASIKIGKSRRIDRHVLDAWIEADKRR